MKKILIASDHAAFEMKSELLSIDFLDGVEWIDLGTASSASVNYPDFAHKLAKRISNEEYDLGVLLCGSGIGMSITANRYSKVRAALCHNTEYAKLAKEHNNANVLVLGARFLNLAEAQAIIKTWLETEFAAGRHQDRIDLIEELQPN
jgi:ribose 5-phosphate isomerase B